jgi:glucuronosyltransferase
LGDIVLFVRHIAAGLVAACSIMSLVDPTKKRFHSASGRSVKCIVTSLTLISLLVSDSSAARVLMTSPQFRSHITMQLAAGEELVNRGHEVYVAVGSRYPNPDEITRSTGVQVLMYEYPSDSMYPASDEAEKALSSYVFGESLYAKSDEPTLFSRFLNEGCEFMMSDDVFLNTVRQLKFDLAVVEVFFLNPCTCLLPHSLGIPFVSLSGMYMPWTVRLPTLPSFHTIPGPPESSSPDVTTFFGRLSSLARYMGAHLLIWPSLWSNTTLIKKYSPAKSADVLTWYELALEGQLYLVMADHHLESPSPLMPNIITVAGLSVRPAGPLPQDSTLNRVVSESTAVILVSFGSTACQIPAVMLSKFFAAFARLHETVIARFCIPDGFPVPKNVHLSSWLPQKDILGHPKTRLFVTHCGLNGLHETIYNGVPVLGFPLFAEQHWNCDRAVDRGLGLQMNVHSFSADQLYNNIRHLIDNLTYIETAKKMSNIFRDEEPMIGRKKAAFWIEHVIKFGGQHLRSKAMDMPLYQFLMLDLIAVIIAFLVCSTAIVCFLSIKLLRCFKKCFRYRKDKTV